MLRSSISKKSEENSNVMDRMRNAWFRIVLAAIAFAAVGPVALPVVVPMLNGTSAGLTHDVYSHVTRSSAFVAYLLLWFSMLAGLSITSKAGRRFPGLSWSFGLHKYATLLGLGFAAMHAFSLLGDQYMRYTLTQLLVPFAMGDFKPRWIGLGQVAFYCLAVVAFSFYVRSRLGMRAWRLVHSLSFSLFLMALVHGLQSGSDSGNWWATGMYWTSAVSVLLGCVYRVLAARMGRSKEKVAATGLIAVGGKAQAQRQPQVLRASSLAGARTLQVSPEGALALD